MLKKKFLSIILLSLMIAIPLTDIRTINWNAVETKATHEPKTQPLNGSLPDKEYTDELSSPPAAPIWKNPPNNLTMINKTEYALLGKDFKVAEFSEKFQKIQKMDY